MLDILTLTIPFFGIIFLGSLCRWKGGFSAAAGQVLTRYVFLVVLPPFLFLAIASRPLSEAFNAAFVLRYELATLGVFLAAVVFGRTWLALPRKESGLFGLNAAYPNYGYIGVPLALLVFGEAAALPMSLLLVADSLLLLILVGLFTQPPNTSRGAAIKDTLRALARNPILLSALAGLGYAAAGLPLPAMPALFLELLAGAAAPTALFAIGVTLVGQPVRGARAELSAIALFKLVLHPAAVIAMFMVAPSFGAPINALWIKVAVLFACLPVAATAYTLSEFYQAYSGRSATAIMVTTLLAGATVPLCLYGVSLWLG